MTVTVMLAAPARGALNLQFTFDLFVCAAILQLQRPQLMRCADLSEVYTATNACVCDCAARAHIRSMVGRLALPDVLGAAEQLFFDYCRKSVSALDGAATPVKVRPPTVPAPSPSTGRTAHGDNKQNRNPRARARHSQCTSKGDGTGKGERCGCGRADSDGRCSGAGQAQAARGAQAGQESALYRSHDAAVTVRRWMAECGCNVACHVPRYILSGSDVSRAEKRSSLAGPRTSSRCSGSLMRWKSAYRSSISAKYLPCDAARGWHMSHALVHGAAAGAERKGSEAGACLGRAAG